LRQEGAGNKGLKKIVWTDEAVFRLTGIEDYISKDSPDRAVKFIESIIDHAESVFRNNPEAGRIVPEISNPAIRELVFKKYRIVYRLNKNRIEVLTVFEGHRLLRIEEIK
jgi:toxin ParE1/3/4